MANSEVFRGKGLRSAGNRLLKGVTLVGAGILLPGLGLLVWEAAARAKLTESQILVPPSSILLTIIEFLQSGELQADVLISVARVAIGFLIGGLSGLAFGLAAGLSRRFEIFAAPTFHVLRQIPVLAWVPILVLFAGFGEAFKIWVISLAAFFPIALNTLDGVKGVAPRYLEVGQSLCFSRRDTLRRIIWPAVLPEILTGARLSLSRSWMLVVVAELVASTSGIGHRMDWGRQLFQIDVVFMGVVVIGLVGLCFDVLIRALASTSTSWKDAH
jgi:sulfonate transport system permease protein